jgi:hypothetical protein
MALGVSSLAYSGAWWAPETERFNSIQQVSRETLLTMVEQGFGLTITSVIYRPDIALIPLPSARAPTAAIISSSDNDNPTLPLLLKCFDTPLERGPRINRRSPASTFAWLWRSHGLSR